MKVSFLTENITNYLPLLGKVIPTNTQLPILSNILLAADKTGLSLRATSMESGVEIKIPAKTETDGTISVPGKEFIEVLNNLPKDKVSLTLKDGTLELSCRGSKVLLNTISAAEFPSLYKEKGVEVIKFDENEFRNVFSYLTFCVSHEETRPQLGGVYIDKKGDLLNFVATDGYRMSVVSVPALKNKIEEGLIVSSELINEALTIKSKNEIILYLNKDENQILFEIGEVLLVGRMIGGSFPDYERVIPKESATKVVFDREQMLQNVKLSSVFAKDISNIVKVEVKDGEVWLSTSTEGIGEGKAVMEGKQTGEDAVVSFNVKYLQDLVRTLSEDTIVMGLNSSNEPAVFEVEGKKFKHVIMPIQAD